MMRDDTRQLVDDFLEFLGDELGVSDLPEIEFVDSDWSDQNRSFGQWDGETIKVVLKGRHPMDVLRTLAHEVIHRVRNHSDGNDGSPDENEANAEAGRLMRKFGKTERANFGLRAEGATVRAFFEGLGPGPEGFETPNQGVARRGPGQGPDSTADAQQMVATDRGEPAGQKWIVWNPGEYGADVSRVLSQMHRMDPLYRKLKDSGPYAQVSLTAAEISELRQSISMFLGARKYTKPEVKFAEDILDQLQTSIHENVSGRSGDGEGFEIARMERNEPTSADYSPDQFSHPEQSDYSFQQLPNGFVRLITPNGNEQVFSDMEKAKSFAEWHKQVSADDPTLTEMFFVEDIKSMKKSVADMKRSVARLDRASSKEQEEHPWASKETAEKIAMDHARKEGKMESVFIFKKRLP